MTFFLPIVMVGALAGSLVAFDATPSFASNAETPQRDSARIVPVSEDADLPGVGAYLKGAIADLSGVPTVALKGYLAALADDPDNMDLRQRAFELSLMADDVPNAVRLARTLPEMEQSTMTRLVQMADFAKQGKVDEARKMARDVSKVSPELLQFRLFQAYLDYAHGAPVPQLVEWLESLNMPESLSGRRSFHIGRLWLKAGEPEKALVYLRKAHAAEPGSVGSALLLGQTLARQGLPGEGAAVYDSFRAANPAVALLVPKGKDLLADTVKPFASTLDDDLAATLTDFGLLIWAQGALSPARQVLNLALWMNPDDVHARYYVGMLLEMGDDLPAAAQHYRALMENDIAGGVPEGVRLAASIRFAEVQFRMGDTDTPWKTLRKLARANPDVVSLQRSVAQLAFSRGDYDQAAESYTVLLNGLPEQASPAARIELLFARGAVYERDGNIKAASKDFQDALAIDPAEAQVLNYLGYMWVDNNINIPQAFQMLKTAHSLAPDDGAITDSLGWAYYKQGDYANAMAYLAQATEQEPESPEIYDHLGDAYAKLGRIEDARREWERALSLLAEGKTAPDDKFEKRVRKKLK
ncbi:MAG: hypothetical protein DI585_04145 [Pseudomonas fluorescens]|nr:MAG: hypothetical protein DI585_04145 [Pseudomonas fluorescens]